MAKKVIDCLYENRNLEKSAIRQGERSISYAELWKTCLTMADKLKSFTTGYVALYMPNSMEYLISYFAGLLCGKTVIPIGYALSEEEVKDILVNTGAEVLVTTKEKMIAGVNCVLCEDMISPLTDVDFDYSAYEAAEVAVVFPTSGTTGRSKYVQLTNENLMQNVADTFEVHGMTREKNMCDNELIVLPATSSFCNTSILVCLYSAMTITFLDGPLTVPKMLQLIQDNEITYCEMTPTLLKIFALYYSRKIKGKTSFKRITSGGENISEQELKEIQALIPDIEIYFGYGLTEASPFVSTQSAGDYLTAGNSVGKLMPSFEIRFAELESGDDYPQGTGEIQLKGPCIMKGYMHEDTPSIVDGWFSTGDIGYMDADKNLHILGRKRNIIISAGRNINAEEVEDALRKCNNIEDAKVYGEKSDLYGEIVVTDIIVKNGASITDEEVINHCKAFLAEYKLPKKVNRVTEIKRNSSGKIIRY